MADTTTLLTRVHVQKCMQGFVEWQTKYHAAIAGFKGFISLEIVNETDAYWAIVQRFSTPEACELWRQSTIYLQLTKELKALLGEDALTERGEEPANAQSGLTEVFVTEVHSGMEEAYRKWLAKVHCLEASFPGFKGMYVQNCGKNWITLLQFDSPEHLDGWLSSSERKGVLQEAKTMIASLENHRVFSPYAGWFAHEKKMPSIWKQAMIVLLVLYPIVMIEMKFLPLFIGNWNVSLATFFGNAISVALITWPMMPLALKGLGWWIASSSKKINLIGYCSLLGLYLIEVVIFWNF